MKQQHIIIAFIGFSLFPLLLYFGGGISELQNSISAYFYVDNAKLVFTTVLSCLGLSLISYNYYDREDNALSWLMGLSCFLVAFFGCNNYPVIHYISALSLFSGMALFCFFLFPKCKNEIEGNFYKYCGFLIVFGVLWVIANKLTGVKSILLPELIAVYSFNAAWFRKFVS